MSGADVQLLPTVVELLSRVMDDVQAVRKGDRNQQQNFNFRGIDSVVNAVGPALRKHGVVAVPTAVTADFEQYETKSKTQMRNAVLTITWRFYGPMGDHIEAQTMGEASDAGDKSVPKAHSVAYRTLLLQALCIPTDEPDPDSMAHERGESSRQETDWTAYDDSEPYRALIDAAGNAAELEALVPKIRGANLAHADSVALKEQYDARLAELTGVLV